MECISVLPRTRSFVVPIALAMTFSSTAFAQTPEKPASPNPAAASSASSNQPSPAPAPTSKISSTPFYVGEELHLYDLVTSYGSFVSGETSNICSLPGTDLRVLNIETGDPSAQYGSLIDVVPLKKGSLPKGLTSYPGCDNDKYLQPGGGLYNVYDSNLEQSRYNAVTVVTGILAVPYKFHISDRSATVGTTIGGYVGYQTSFQNLFTVTPIFSLGLALVSSSPAQAGSNANSATPTSSSGTPSASSGTNAGVSVATGFIGTVSNQGKSGLQYGFVVGIDWVGKSVHYAYEGKPWFAAEIGYNFSVPAGGGSASSSK